MARRAQMRERAERIEAGEQRHRQALARRIEPERGRAGQDADPVVRPDRPPVLDALGVVPHPVAVDEMRAGCFRDAEHAPVDVVGHARDHFARRLAHALGPVPAHEIMIAADAARRDDDRLRPEAE